MEGTAENSQSTPWSRQYALLIEYIPQLPNASTLQRFNASVVMLHTSTNAVRQLVNERDMCQVMDWVLSADNSQEGRKKEDMSLPKHKTTEERNEGQIRAYWEFDARTMRWNPGLGWRLWQRERRKRSTPSQSMAHQKWFLAGSRN